MLCRTLKLAHRLTSLGKGSVGSAHSTLNHVHKKIYNREKEIKKNSRKGYSRDNLNVRDPVLIVFLKNGGQ